MDVDQNEKVEENYFEWRERETAYLKLPGFRPKPRSAQREFSTERSKRAKARAKAAA